METVQLIIVVASIVIGIALQVWMFVTKKYNPLVQFPAWALILWGIMAFFSDPQVVYLVTILAFAATVIYGIWQLVQMMRGSRVDDGR